MNTILFVIPLFIWGFTWYIIKFQLGVVDPMISVIYRFFLASFILLLYARMRGYKLKYSVKEHLSIALQGISLFGINYWLVYIAEETLTSGLVAILFSLLIFANIFHGALILKIPIQRITIFSALMGVAGTGLIFSNEFSSFSYTDINIQSVIWVLISVGLASLGNVLSGYNQRLGIKVVPGNAYSMLYGALSLLIPALILGKTFGFSMEFSYVSSLLFLTLFGSIIAFTAYLTLLGRIGPHKAAYITLLIPLIAIGVSTIFEDYQWTINAVIGILLLLAGNYLILRAKSQDLTGEH